MRKPINLGLLVDGSELGVGRMSGLPDQWSQLQDFLHHLKGWETAAQSKAIKWNVESAIAAQHRVDRLGGMLRQFVTKLTGH